jgi:hypothetical protein
MYDGTFLVESTSPEPNRTKIANPTNLRVPRTIICIEYAEGSRIAPRMKIPAKVVKNVKALARPLFSTIVFSVRYSMLAGIPKPKVAPHRRAKERVERKLAVSIIRGMNVAAALTVIQTCRKRVFPIRLGKKAPTRAATAVAIEFAVKIERYS